MRIENSFIPVRGIGEATERRLWRAGVTHWDDFDGRVLGPTLTGRVESFLDEAWRRLDGGDAGFFADALPSRSAWRLYGTFGPEACFLDIETTGLSPGWDDVTTVSLHRAGGTTTLVRGRDLTRGALRRALADVPLLVTFNGARFDVPFLERAFDLTIDRPHLDLVYPCRRVGLTGGLKLIERDLGIARDRPDLSGRDAVRLWHRYEAGDDAALDTLVAYNREDTENLRAVADAVAARLHDRVFEAALDHGGDDRGEPRQRRLGTGGTAAGVPSGER